MKLFGRTSGYYLFWTGFVYFWVGMYFAFTQYALPEYATLGFADNNRVSFQMNYAEITMNKAGCQQMIDQLAFFQSQLYDEDGDGGPDGDGGEPVPVPEQKAA